jgi:hypothetical protein
VLFRSPSEDFDKVVGKYIFIRRNGQRNVAKLEWVDKKDKRFGYTLMSGRDKGRKANAKFFTGTFVNAYDEESLVVALLEV